MTGSKNQVLVAVAWPYASGPRHVGHVAGFGVPSDVFARYQRLAGNDVLMVSGTDDHGTPITIAADREGVTSQALADRYNAVIGDDLRDLGLSYDLFTRTATTNHHRVTQDVFKVLHDKGYLVERTTMGAISARTGRTLPDRYIEGTCPICGSDDARGDQCDDCGNQLDPIDLIDPRSKIDGEPPRFVETEHFFLDLPAFSGRLQEWIGKQDHWRPNVRNFSLQFVDDLKARAITRDIDWGVRVPLPGWEARDDKRIYVWFDAVIGYLSASIEWADAIGEPDSWRRFWENESARHYYFMGKDNIVFHSVIWPAELMGHGGLTLPYDVVSSEFLTMEGKKFSSSRNVVIYVRDVLARYSPDALRFFLTVAGPEQQDTDFTWSEFVRRNNDELVATWGNLAHRTLTLCQRNFGGAPPPGHSDPADSGLRSVVAAGFSSVGDLLGRARFKASATALLDLCRQVNQYLSDQAPWKIVEAERDRAAAVLLTALRCVDDLSVMWSPVLPHSSQRLHELLGYTDVLAALPRVEVRPAGHRVLTGDYRGSAGWWHSRDIEPGRPLPPPAPLFTKLDPSVVDEELALLTSGRGDR